MCAQCSHVKTSTGHNKLHTTKSVVSHSSKSCGMADVLEASVTMMPVHSKRISETAVLLVSM
eukprot:COSAG01_NODE_5745_length_4062_cov_1.625284_1_plen_62_part_00